ncbi:MAG: HNH endonuclease [Gammaproteobacteria bacterium]
MIKIKRPQCPNQSALFSGNYKHADNKSVLIEANFDKCMYCESKVSHVYFGDIEHIKPKKLFPELEFDWGNLGFACAKCNGSKKDNYDAKTPCVDPYLEAPDNFLIALGPFIKHKQGSERGEYTIKIIDLNRAQLIEKRLHRLTQIEKAIDACFRTQNEELRKAALAELLIEAHQDKEYSLIVRSLFIQHKLI